MFFYCRFLLLIIFPHLFFFFFFFNDTATTEIYTLSLHDALPICVDACVVMADRRVGSLVFVVRRPARNVIAGIPVGIGLPRRETVPQPHHHISDLDRKSTRLNSSHLVISYAVFCLKKKKT